jgi:hypothetical protein
MPAIANATSFKPGHRPDPPTGRPSRLSRSVLALTSKRKRKKHIAALSLIIDNMADKALRGEPIDEVKYAALLNERRQELRDL